MINALGHKPVMNGHHQCGIFCGIPNLRAVRQQHILEVDLPSSGSQLDQPGHIFPMTFGWIREVTALKLFRRLLEVGLNKGDLLAVGGIFRSDGLQSAVV